MKWLVPLAVTSLLACCSNAASADIWSPFDWNGKGQQASKPQLPTLPKFEIPTVQPPAFKIPRLTAPSPTHMVDKLSDSTRKVVDKGHDILTSDNVRTPVFPVAAPKLEMKMPKLPFGGGKQRGPSKSRFPGWLRTTSSQESQPPTLESWLGQPRPE